MNPEHSLPFKSVWLAAVVLSAAAVGCGLTGPRTYSVNGKVVYKGKGNVSQLDGGKVRFQSVSDPDLSAVGSIDESGAFSMGAMRKDKDLSGVPAGQYKVRVDPPRDDDEGKPLRIIDPKYQDFNKSGITVTIPVSGDLVIEVERPGR